MVWRISKKKEVTQKDIEQTALYGLVLIIGLGILAWGTQHLQYIGQNMSKQTFKEFAEACWNTHKQVGFKTSSKTGKRVPNCVPKNEDNEQEIEEVSAAMRALRRRNAKSARAKNTIAKYGQAAKMGIPASQVNQRRSAVTRKKI